MLFLVQCILTGYLTGLIWFVQIVHYPLFKHVDEAHFPEYHHQHTRRTFWAAGLPMVFELAAAVVLFGMDAPRDAGRAVWLTWTAGNLLTVLLLWLVTLTLQAPQHGRLSKNWSCELHHRLVRGNWIRTALWSFRSLWLVVGGTWLA